MAENSNTALSINNDAQNRLVNYVKASAVLRDEGFSNRTRFENIDRSYMLEKDFTEETRKADRANRAGNVLKLQNMQVPMVMESVENSVGFLTNVFLTDYPMFKFGAGPEYEDLALMWNTLVGEDQVHYGWAGQFNIAFRNGAKYNFAPIEVDWCEQTLYKSTNGNGPNGAVLKETIWAGNKIKALDPYNTIYDPRCPIYQVHERGEFAGYIENMSRIELKLFLATLGDSRLKNDKKAFESSPGEMVYYIPAINPDSIMRNRNIGEFDWVKWVTDDAQRHINYKNMYTVCILYARIMPFEFGIHAPKDQTPDIWKLVTVNNILVYANPVPNAHNYLPVIIVQPNVDNLSPQTKTLAENQVKFQSMVSALWNAELNIARRAAVDRMIYNPLLIDPDHINSPNPGAKIPLRPTAYGRKLDEAVFKIPFEGSAGGLYMQAAQGVSEWGMRANGQNRVSVGQFQKGNKLENEFNTTMANAGARERTQAIMWEVFGMQPVKAIIKSNNLQFTPKGTRYNREEKQQVDIDPVKLREIEGDFAVGDGLLPIERLMHSDVATEAFQAMAAMPAIAMSYEMGPMFTYLMSLKGVDKLKQFQKDPEQLAYQSALGQWTTSAMDLAKAKPSVTPEELQKVIDMIIGPKPVDPAIAKQQAAQDPTQQGNPNAPTTT